jgi:lauroyl/myristoyl acyltransferase
VIHRAAGAPLAILTALRAGRARGLARRRRARLRAARLLGARVEAPIGPARLARAAGCRIVVGTLEPDPSEPRTRFRLRIEPVEMSEDDAHTTQRVMDVLTRAIERSPSEWLWMARPLGNCRAPVAFAEKSR